MLFSLYLKCQYSNTKETNELTDEELGIISMHLTHVSEKDFLHDISLAPQWIQKSSVNYIKKTDKVTNKVTERRHMKMQFCNDAIDERAIRLPWNGRKRNASLTTRALDKEKTG